ncbi:MAG TPA: hypothetical protein DCZ95_01855 [Verrucomicrobia bacterium]|nr:hypothetical protein [Verrucomicrobiota bacterium]
MTSRELLMVEDNRGDVVLVQEALRKVGLLCRVNVVSDGVEALAYLRRQGRYAGAARPDLIVLDLKLPRKSGREVLEEIQQDLSLCDIPFIIFSSSKSELELARASELPAHRYMVKPSQFEGYVDFVRVIEEILTSGGKGALS